MIQLRWAARKIPFVVRVPAEADVDMRTLAGATLAAARTWNEIECSDVELEFRGLYPMQAEVAEDTQIVVVASGWAVREDGSERNPRHVGVTRTRYGLPSGTIVRGTIELNAEMFRLTDAQAECVESDGGKPVMDLEAVITHELGHLLGIAHACDREGSFQAPPEMIPIDQPGVTVSGLADASSVSCAPAVSCSVLALEVPNDRPTMWPTVEPCDLFPRKLEADDTAALCTIYPAGLEAGTCPLLPPETSVSNEAFGCSAAGRAAAPAGGLAAWLVALILIGTTLRGPRRSSSRRDASVPARGRSRPSS